ncbi:uncharacterized protein LOC121593098 [Anopheles merus]|uniref:uncharacterized protein LOC121593098 n=1 Tax=Anopheles merus TaxID=30066 RepID=UPI001BE4C5DA|nr:uncharacterized protein LOC121593098 [Anopheles merus]
MAVSQLVEKLKFGDRYVLVNIVVKPVEDPPYRGSRVGFGFAERNKFISSEIWQSFVYPKLREIFDQNLALIGENIDPAYDKNKDYYFKCAERPYLEMRVNFRDCFYRNKLNILFQEDFNNLHHCCFYVEIRDRGRNFAEKIERCDTFIQLLMDENKRMKAQIAAHKAAPKDATGVEGNDPKPVKQRPRRTVEEHAPEAPSVHPTLIKRTHKSSADIADSSQPGPSSAPDSNISEQAAHLQKMADKRKQENLAGPSKTKIHKAKKTTNNDQAEKEQEKPKVLDCTDMPESEILATFAGYRQELHEIFLKHKDQLEEQWMVNKELVYYTDVAHLFNEDQKMAMMQVLENEFVPIELNGKYTEFFTSTLLMEWIIRIFMKRYKFTTRQDALKLIKKQENEVLEYIARDW